MHPKSGRPYRPREKRKLDLYKLAIARSDVKESLDYCNLISSLQGGNAGFLRPIARAATLAYARPFVAIKPPGQLPKEWMSFSTKELQETHERAIAYRHRWAAHSDPMERPLLIVPPRYQIPGSAVRTERVSVMVPAQHLPREFFSGLTAVCNDLIPRMSARIDAFLEDLYGDALLYGDPFPLPLGTDPLYSDEVDFRLWLEGDGIKRRMITDDE